MNQLKQIAILASIISTIGIFASSIAFADADQDFNGYLFSQLTSADNAFQKACSSQEMMSSNSPDIEYKQFFLSITPSVNFGISKVLNLQIAPELTFVWEKVDY